MNTWRDGQSNGSGRARHGIDWLLATLIAVVLVSLLLLSVVVAGLPDGQNDAELGPARALAGTTAQPSAPSLPRN
jgi:hypothetical protein